MTGLTPSKGRLLANTISLDTNGKFSQLCLDFEIRWIYRALAVTSKKCLGKDLSELSI